MAHWVPQVVTQGDVLGPPVSQGTWGVDIDPAPAQRGPARVPLAPNHLPRRIQLLPWSAPVNLSFSSSSPDPSFWIFGVEVVGSSFSLVLLLCRDIAGIVCFTVV